MLRDACAALSLSLSLSFSLSSSGRKKKEKEKKRGAECTYEREERRGEKRREEQSREEKRREEEGREAKGRTSRAKSLSAPFLHTRTSANESSPPMPMPMPMRSSNPLECARAKIQSPTRAKPSSEVISKAQGKSEHICYYSTNSHKRKSNGGAKAKAR